MSAIAETTPPPKPEKPPKSVTTSNEAAPDTSTAAASVGDGDGEQGDEVVDIVQTGTKNVAELLAMDSGDESLRKYKESLLGAAAHGDLGNTADPRRVVVEEFRVIFAPEEKMPDIVHTLSTAEGLAKLSSEGITMPEGSNFKFKITFRVQHEIVAGVKFVNQANRMMVSTKEELMIGSYPPASTPHDFEFPKRGYSEAPKGMLMRGKYKVRNSFVDSDKVTHLEFEYELNIVKK